MTKRNLIVQRIKEQTAVAVIRMSDSQKIKKVVEAIYKGGVSVIEITMTVPNALKAIEELNNFMKEELLIGVGSVLNKQTAIDAVNAGSKFVVSPLLKPEIIQTVHSYDLPAVPGCFTPTEIQSAYEFGADIIKIFPSDVLGMNFFKAVLTPMPYLNLMPTGGVSLTNAGDWIKAGACAVGVGSALLDKEAIAKENYSKLTENAAILTKSIQSAKL